MKEIILPFLIPLITAAASIALRKTYFRDYVSVTGSLAYLGSVILLVSRVTAEGSLTLQAGGWPAPYGITFVADSLSVLMLGLTAVVSLAGNIYSGAYIGSRGKDSGYYAFFHFMVAGMSGAFLTGDIFNLFVMFEMILISSYAMVAYTGTRQSLFTSLKYVLLNLIGSSLMLVAIGGIYAVTGSLNMADIALKISENPALASEITGFAMILFTVFAIKSGLVPFHFWAPPVYSNSPPPAAAMMAGISKKVGIYAIIRIFITVFEASSSIIGSLLGPVMLLMASGTVLLGGLSALNRKKLDRILSYSSIGQVGFIFIPLGISIFSGSVNALAASLVYLVSHAFAKPALFMISGIIEGITGTTKLEELGGLSESSVVFSSTFFLSAFSLVGIPPLIGFFGKMLAFKTAITSGSMFLFAVLLFGAFSTLLYFTDTWLKVFFGEPVEFDTEKVSHREILAVMMLVLLIVLLGIDFDMLYQAALNGSETAFGTQQYIETVLGDTK